MAINIKNQIGVALKGMAMGVAEVIPGVSGGTIAFITGIYEKLLNTIKAFSPSLLKTLKEDGIRAVWQAINGNFLVALLIGMVGGILIGTFGVSHLLENYPVLLWAFFFGLIAASVIYIAKQIEKWGAVEVLLFLLATGLSYYITVVAPAQGNHALWFVFLSGMIAICALILPGVSGSFILLLMGMYTYILPTAREALSTFATDKLTILAVFALGCLTGLLSFANLVSWTFEHYRKATLATLTGFMLGSLNKVWPWRNVIQTRTNSHGEEVPFLEQSVLPTSFDGETYLMGVLALMVAGFISVFLLERLGNSEG
ncbi:MAG: DUF368 domain-containing protein [Chitinophagales bacterium]